MTREDLLEETLPFIRNSINNNISKNDLDVNHLVLDGEIYTGPTVEFIHTVLTGFRDIIDYTLDRD